VTEVIIQQKMILMSKQGGKMIMTIQLLDCRKRNSESKEQQGRESDAEVKCVTESVCSKLNEGSSGD
jgi:hypothetical protein